MCLCPMSPSILKSHPWRRKPHSGRPEAPPHLQGPLPLLGHCPLPPLFMCKLMPRDGYADPSSESHRRGPRTEGDPRVWADGWRHNCPTPKGAPSKRARKPQPSAGRIPSAKFPCGDGRRQPHVPRVLATSLLISASHPQALPEDLPGLGGSAAHPPVPSPSCSAAPSLSFLQNANSKASRHSDTGDGQPCKWGSDGSEQGRGPSSGRLLVGGRGLEEM